MCRMQIQWGLQLEGKTINTEEKRQKQWWRVKHTVDKKNKRGNKNVVKKKKKYFHGKRTCRCAPNCPVCYALFSWECENMTRLTTRKKMRFRCFGGMPESLKGP